MPSSRHVQMQGVQRATKLHFPFYRSSTQAAQEDQIGLDNAGELCTIEIPALYALAASEHDLLRQLIHEYQVPQYLRYVRQIGFHA